jgi:hypothetical protein
MLRPLVARIRSQVTKGSVTVLDELRDGSTYAERHAFHIRLKNGSTQDREVDPDPASFPDEVREFASCATVADRLTGGGASDRVADAGQLLRDGPQSTLLVGVVRLGA